MKKNSCHGPPARRLRVQPLTLGLTLLASVASLLAGCSKTKSPSGGVSPPSQSASTNPARANTSAATGDVATNGEPDLRALNRQFISYEMQNQRYFKTVEEFESAANVQFPPPPTGEKYVINKRGYIILVNQ